MKSALPKTVTFKKKAPAPSGPSREFAISVGIVFLVFTSLFILPLFFAWKDTYEPPQARLEPFTVTVDPVNKLITENPDVEAILSPQTPLLSAAAGNLLHLFDGLSSVLSESSVYDSLASVGAPAFINVDPGLRIEEVAALFAKELEWSAEAKAEFLEIRKTENADIPDGTVFPGLYAVRRNAGPNDIHRVTEERFENQVLSRYASSTEAMVPLKDTLIIASMIQRETADKQEMRIISGIIWNRIFLGMPLQLDATLQYAKANKKTARQTDWWPNVYPRDKYISSPFNTYQNRGLPPAPISNPALSAVIAALNPKKTDCIFYFHDRKGGFHCTETYEEHVALLKKHYGRGR
jgi:cell division protein YceG involved in septum cleavage